MPSNRIPIGVIRADRHADCCNAEVVLSADHHLVYLYIEDLIQANNVDVHE